MPKTATAPELAEAFAARVAKAKSTYDEAWRAYINHALWDKGFTKWTLVEQATMDKLADNAHQTFWVWRDLS